MPPEHRDPNLVGPFGEESQCLEPNDLNVAVLGVLHQGPTDVLQETLVQHCGHWVDPLRDRRVVLQPFPLRVVIGKADGI